MSNGVKNPRTMKCKVAKAESDNEMEKHLGVPSGRDVGTPVSALSTSDSDRCVHPLRKLTFSESNFRDMERVSKQHLENIVLHGLATDIFIAERAFSLFKAIGEHPELIKKKSGVFFKSAQEAFKDQYLLALARLFDNASDKNPTRCMEGLLRFLSNNNTRLPKIIERPNLVEVLGLAGFQKETISLAQNENSDAELAIKIVRHFEEVISNQQNQKLLLTLKKIRDKRLAHNELRAEKQLVETIDVITFKDLYALLAIAKNFLGIIGWAYMSTVFMHNGEYHLSNDAVRPVHSLKKLLESLE